MIIDHLTEVFWKKVKLILLFIICAGVIYIVLTKFIIKVPIINNTELLTSIDEFEKTLEKQKETIEVSKKINEEITVMEFDIHQVQKQDEIKREIHKIESIHKDNKMSSKYNFSLQMSKILSIYYDTRREHSSLIHNKDLVEKNLNECQANI